MAEAGGFGALEREVTILRERQEQNRTRIEDMQKRADTMDTSLRALAILPVQQQELKADVTEIKASVQEITREQQRRAETASRDKEERDQWLKAFELQVKTFKETRQQNIRSSTLVVVGMAITIVIAIVGLVAGILETVIK